MGRGQELLEAAREGDRWTVEKILGQITKRSGPFTSLRRGAGVNVQDDNGYTPLHHACLRGHKDIVRLLLSVDALPCVVDKKGATPLHLAAWKGDSDIVSMLLEHNNPSVNIDQRTSDQETPLLIAAQFGYVEVVAQLLARGADADLRNMKDETALDLAAQYGRLETVQHMLRVRPLLVQPYKYPNSRDKIFSHTPLHRASMNGHKDVVLTLLDAGFDPNVRTYVGTPLHEAACFGKASVVRILLAKGADLRAVDGRGMTVESVLVEYSGEAIKRVRRVIREYESMAGNYNDVDEELPPFPVQGYSPTGYTGSAHLKAPETQKNTNKNESLFPSSSSLTKSSPQSFVKKLASKCLGLKAKFNSAPNISNSTGLESETDVKSKHSDSKNSVNTLLIGNSKFFKILSKKEESGEIVCNDEFDTISLDRLGTLNRDSSVNRSNRSCPGFKTSLPNISENNELSDSQESIVDSSVVTDIHGNKNGTDLITFPEAVNYDAKLNIFEPRSKQNRKTIVSTISLESATLINECYESYEFSSQNSLDCMKPLSSLDVMPLPKPTPRSPAQSSTNDVMIYENIVLDSKHAQPTPAIRTHIPPKNTFNHSFSNPLYENINLTRERTLPEVSKRNVMSLQQRSNSSSPNRSRSSTISSDSMVDESNLEDIFLSTKSKSFRHTKIPLLYDNTNRSNIHRVPSDVSDLSDQTEASALENVDCSGDVVLKGINLSMTGTLPNKKTERGEGKKVLFRHKTFTNIEVDRHSTNIRDLPKWNGSFLKETLPNYHIRGTSHCIHKAPTVQEFIHIFNRDSLQQDVGSSAKGTNNKRDSYFETAICFCKPRPSKHHASAEDLLEINKVNEERVIIDMGDLKDAIEFRTSSFRCFCDTKMCILHDYRRQKYVDFVIKFSAIKKSISTPDISLEASPSSYKRNMGLTKIKSVPSNLATPYATVNVEKETPGHYKTKIKHSDKTLDNSKYVTMISHSSTSSSYDRYSVKDIAEVISLSNNSTSADTNPSCASDTMQILLHKSSSSEHSGQWSLQSCNSNVTIKSDASFKTCLEESSEDDSDANSHSDEETSDAETVKSDISTTKRPWVHTDSFKFGSRDSKFEIDVISEDSEHLKESKCESGISIECSESSSSGYEDDSGVPRLQTDVLLDCASLERGRGVGDVRSGSGRRRWDEPEGTSEGDALSVSSAASSCAPLHMTHHHDYNKVSPTPPKKPPRRNLSVSPTHANSPSSGYSYELRAHARSQDDLDDIQGAKHYLKHGRSVDHYVDGKLSYPEYEENHNSPRVIPVPNPRPSLKHRSQPVAITAMYENVVIKEQNPRRKLRRNNFSSPYENIEIRMNDTRTRKFSNQEKSSLESLLDDQSMNSPGECERYYDRHKPDIPLSPTHYEQPPTPDHPPPSAKQAENSIHERIRPLSQLIMEVVEEIRIRKKSQGDVTNS